MHTGRLSGIRKGNSHSTILFEIVLAAGLKNITIADRTTKFEGSYRLYGCTADAACLVETFP
jgi:hypothetical protein